MSVSRKPKQIYFRNGNQINSKELAIYLAISVFQLYPEEVIRYIDRGITSRTALQQLLLFYDEEVKKREDYEKKIRL